MRGLPPPPQPDWNKQQGTGSTSGFGLDPSFLPSELYPPELYPFNNAPPPSSIPSSDIWDFSGTFENVIFNIDSSVIGGTQQINPGVLTQEDSDDLVNTVYDMKDILEKLLSQQAGVQEIAQATAQFVSDTLQHQNMRENFDRLDRATQKIPESKPFVYRLAAKLMSLVCPG